MKNGYIRSVVQKSLLFWCFLLLSLVNYSVYVTFACFCSLVLYISIYSRKFPFSQVLFAQILLVCVVVFALKFIIVDIGLVAKEQASFNLGLLLNFFILVFILVFSRGIVDSHERSELKDIVRLLIILNFVVVMSQVFVFSSFGVYLDVHQILTGEESRYSMDGVAVIPIRYTGLYLEPSNLGAVALALHAIYTRLNGWRLDVITVLSVAMCVVCFSTLILIVGFVYFFVLFILFSKKKLMWLLLFFLASAVVLFLISDTLPYQLMKISRNMGMRLNIVDVIAKRDFIVAFFGHGPFGIDREIFYITRPDAVNRLASINDMGGLVFLVIVFGYFGVFLFLLMLLMVRGVRGRCVYLVVSALKVSIFHPIFLLFFSVYSSKKLD